MKFFFTPFWPLSRFFIHSNPKQKGDALNKHDSAKFRFLREILNCYFQDGFRWINRRGGTFQFEICLFFFVCCEEEKRAGFFSVGQVSVPLIWSQEEREPETLKEKKVSE